MWFIITISLEKKRKNLPISLSWTNFEIATLRSGRVPNKWCNFVGNGVARNVLSLPRVFRESLYIICLVHPRPRVNLDLNFGDRIGGRITIEVASKLLFYSSYMPTSLLSQPTTSTASARASSLPSTAKSWSWRVPSSTAALRAWASWAATSPQATVLIFFMP